MLCGHHTKRLQINSQPIQVGCGARLYVVFKCCWCLLLLLLLSPHALSFLFVKVASARSLSAGAVTRKREVLHLEVE